MLSLKEMKALLCLIIQQIHTMPIYGQKVIVIRHPYIYNRFCDIRRLPRFIRNLGKQCTTKALFATFSVSLAIC